MDVVSLFGRRKGRKLMMTVRRGKQAEMEKMKLYEERERER